jgi:UDP-N-acetylglucosamine transferase subunit ALG13/putative flippase GtrA
LDFLILVTLGTQDKGFERLLKQVDEEIKKGNIKEKVVVQAGYTKYESPNMKIFDLIPADEFDDLVSKARLIITHAGAGSILSAVKKGKVVIAAPRLKKYGEHTNDHQLQIAKEFADAGYILELRDFHKLDKLLEKSKTFKPKKFVSNTPNMVKLVSDYIEETDNISWYNKYSEFLWYGFFGVLTTLINIVSFALLDKTGLNVYFSNLIAWLLSVLFAFITNKLFVFNSKDFTFKVFFKELVSFFFFRILSLGIDMAGMFICLESIKLSKLISKIIVNVIVIVANYIFSKLFIFKKKSSEV